VVRLGQLWRCARRQRESCTGTPAANVPIGAAKGIHVRVLPRVRLISPAPDNGIERYYKMVS